MTSQLFALNHIQVTNDPPGANNFHLSSQEAKWNGTSRTTTYSFLICVFIHANRSIGLLMQPCLEHVRRVRRPWKRNNVITSAEGYLILTMSRHSGPCSHQQSVGRAGHARRQGWCHGGEEGARLLSRHKKISSEITYGTQTEEWWSSGHGEDQACKAHGGVLASKAEMTVAHQLGIHSYLYMRPGGGRIQSGGE